MISKFSTPIELQQAIDSYFDDCNCSSMKLKDQIPYTSEGLAMVLGLDRVELKDYTKKNGFENYYDIIEAAKAKVQKNKVDRCLAGLSCPRITLFDLVNNSYYSENRESFHLIRNKIKS